MTEHELFKALRILYPAAEYALLPQVANGTGTRATRHCDALALSLWPSRGLNLSGFEMKSYRGDWLRELRNPQKAEDVAKFCNYWWIVAGGKFVTADEVPQGWGLLAWDEKKSGLVKVKPAPFKEAETPDLPFLAAALRKAQETIGPESAVTDAKIEGYKKGLEDGKLQSQHDSRDLVALRAAVKDFEKHSGIRIDTWGGGKELGRAVNLVVNGFANRERKALMRIAEEILREFGEENKESAA